MITKKLKDSQEEHMNKMAKQSSNEMETIKKDILKFLEENFGKQEAQQQVIQSGQSDLKRDLIRAQKEQDKAQKEKDEAVKVQYQQHTQAPCAVS